MIKRAHLLAIGCFVVGAILSAGVTWWIATIHYGKISGKALLTVEQIHGMEAGQRATGAYRHESPPISIYELKHYLATLQREEKIPDNPIIPLDLTYHGLTLTHGRLAKIYAAVGETNLSFQVRAD